MPQDLIESYSIIAPYVVFVIYSTAALPLYNFLLNLFAY